MHDWYLLKLLYVYFSVKMYVLKDINAKSKRRLQQIKTKYKF